MIFQTLDVPVERFEKDTGWSLKPEGACRGEICVPLPDGVTSGVVDVRQVAGRLGMPLVRHADEDLWALGPASLTGHALPTAVAPELELPDLDGRMFRLSSLRGQKVVIVSWAPY
jgi:hypothetical protein